MSKQSPLSNRSNRWLLLVVIGIVAYGLSQPYLNAWFGINLPSLAQFAQEAETGDDKPRVVPHDEAPERDLELVTGDVDSTSQESQADQRTKAGARIEPSGETASTPQGNGKPSSTAASADANEPAVDPRTEYLKETPPGSESYLSPQGLRYTRGSEEGHRLKHLERHLVDQPNRPGKHGVFTGDLLQVLEWLDDAYARGKRKAKGTRQRTEDGRTIYEVPFDEAIGYVGGQVGRREGHPDCKKIRLVVEGNRVITAFPF